MKSAREHSQALLKKAANDLVAARATLATEMATDTICFHAQQAVEKRRKRTKHCKRQLKFTK